jgi:hypothetical protein
MLAAAVVLVPLVQLVELVAVETARVLLKQKLHPEQQIPVEELAVLMYKTAFQAALVLLSFVTQYKEIQ